MSRLQPATLGAMLLGLLPFGIQTMGCGSNGQPAASSTEATTTDGPGDSEQPGASDDGSTSAPAASTESPSATDDTTGTPTSMPGGDTTSADEAMTQPSDTQSNTSSGSSSTSGSGEACGTTVCHATEVCCNPSCNLCSPPGGTCGQVLCGPGDPPAPPCETDDDCRLFEDYCTGCDCRALSRTELEPICPGPGVSCFAPACLTKVAACDNGSCVAADAQ